MGLGIDPKVDLAFKKVFASEENIALLIDLLTAVAQPSRGISGLEIVLPHSEKASPEDKLAIADVKARDQGNRQFHVEMQWLVDWFFPNRVLFYWGKFHPQQLHEGEDYRTLRPTISVCFTNQTRFPQVEDYHLVFRVLDEKHGLRLCDDLEIHWIELPKFTKTVEQLETALDRWCYFFRHGADLDLKTLPPTLDVPEIRRALEVLTVFTQEEREREAYELRIKYQLDEQSLRGAAEERAEKRGIEKGIEKGIQKGNLIGQVRLCQELLKQPQAAEAELAALPQEELANLLAGLRARLLTNGA